MIPPVVDASWHPVINDLLNDRKLVHFKNNILPQTPFYPKGPENIFKVFSTPLQDIKIVILGQDPYPNGATNGLAFAVNQGKPIPASLEVIRQELISEKLSVSNYTSFNWRELTHWKDQGVFLLNTALTVEANNAGSHLQYWQFFTIKIIDYIAKCNPCIWMLWGGKARGYRSYAIGNVGMLVNKKSDFDKEEYKYPINFILEAPHPAAEKYNKGKGEKFTGCNHFKLANEILAHRNQSIINW